jgi:predicted SnoaL-like aldol condensation-catalyzing enzyme
MTLARDREQLGTSCGSCRTSTNGRGLSVDSGVRRGDHDKCAGFPEEEALMTNKDLVRQFFEGLFNDADADVADEIAAPVYIEHAVAPFGREEPGPVPGPAHVRATAEWLRRQYPDIRMTIESMVEEGDLVVARVLSEGTNTGKLNGILPPTGRRFSARQSHWFRVADGRLAEHWATREDLPAMMQLGVIAPPGPPGPQAT